MINLFAESLNENMGQFLATYREGDLHLVAYARACDDKAHPHTQFMKFSLKQDYIVFEISDMVTKEDVAWLYQKILVEKQDPDRAMLFEYIWSKMGTNGKGIPEHRRSQRLWEKAKLYRKQLEIPRLAFKHFDRSSHNHADHMVDIVDKIVVIQYNTQARRQQAAAH